MRTKLWLFIGLLVVIVPCYALTPATADQGSDYIGIDMLYYANLAFYTAHTEYIFSDTYYCRPFYAYPNETIMVFTQDSYFSGSGVAPSDIKYHQASNGTLYLITARNFDYLARRQPHEKLVLAYEPRDFTPYSIVVPSEDLYLICAISNYSESAIYQSFGTTYAQIYRIPYGYGGNNTYNQNFNNFTTNNYQNTTYNTENTENTYNTHNTTHNTYNNVPPLGIAMGIGGLVCLVLLNFLRIKRS